MKLFYISIFLVTSLFIVSCGGGEGDSGSTVANPVVPVDDTDSNTPVPVDDTDSNTPVDPPIIPQDGINESEDFFGRNLELKKAPRDIQLISGSDTEDFLYSPQGVYYTYGGGYSKLLFKDTKLRVRRAQAGYIDVRIESIYNGVYLPAFFFKVDLQGQVTFQSDDSPDTLLRKSQNKELVYSENELDDYGIPLAWKTTWMGQMSQMGNFVDRLLIRDGLVISYKNNAHSFFKTDLENRLGGRFLDGVGSLCSIETVLSADEFLNGGYRFSGRVSTSEFLDPKTMKNTRSHFSDGLIVAGKLYKKESTPFSKEQPNYRKNITVLHPEILQEDVPYGTLVPGDSICDFLVNQMSSEEITEYLQKDVITGLSMSELSESEDCAPFADNSNELSKCVIRRDGDIAQKVSLITTNISPMWSKYLGENMYTPNTLREFNDGGVIANQTEFCEYKDPQCVKLSKVRMLISAKQNISQMLSFSFLAELADNGNVIRGYTLPLSVEELITDIKTTIDAVNSSLKAELPSDNVNGDKLLKIDLMHRGAPPLASDRYDAERLLNDLKYGNIVDKFQDELTAIQAYRDQSLDFVSREAVLEHIFGYPLTSFESTGTTLSFNLEAWETWFKYVAWANRPVLEREPTPPLQTVLPISPVVDACRGVIGSICGCNGFTCDGKPGCGCTK